MIGGREKGQKDRANLHFYHLFSRNKRGPILQIDNSLISNVTFQLRNMNFLNFSVLLFFAHLLYQIKGTSLPSSHCITHSKGPTEFLAE